MKAKILMLRTPAFLMLSLLLALPAYGQTLPFNILRYAHVANGFLGSNPFVTTLLVSNPQNFAIQAFIESFYAGDPNQPIRLNFATNCAFDSSNNFTIPSKSTCRFESDGLGTLRTGWLRVVAAVPSDNLGGYLQFTYYQGSAAAGMPIYTVGVSPSPIMHEFSFPVVRNASKFEDIGFAIANVYNDGGVSMRVTLYNAAGVQQGDPVPLNLGTLGQAAWFMSQLFPAFLGSADGFVGTAVVNTPISVDDAIGTVLLNRGNIFGGATINLDNITSNKSGTRVERQEFGSTASREKLMFSSSVTPF